MRVATWNVNSIRARRQHVLRWLETHEPDVLCLQELKATDEDFPIEEARTLGYEAALYGQKTYNGVGIVSRLPMQSITKGLPLNGEKDKQARLIGADIDGVRIYSAYFPNGGEVGSDKYRYKLRWMAVLRAYLDDRFDGDRDPVALCGDFNVAPADDDIGKPKQWRSSVLACDEVRKALAEVKAFGFEDVVRPFHPEGGVFSWWDYRARGLERNNGLRIDHVFASHALAPRTIGAIVDKNERREKSPSDHAPVVVEFA